MSICQFLLARLLYLKIRNFFRLKCYRNVNVQFNFRLIIFIFFVPLARLLYLKIRNFFRLKCYRNVNVQFNFRLVGSDAHTLYASQAKIKNESLKLHAVLPTCISYALEQTR